MQSGKPKEIAEKMVEGRMLRNSPAKFLDRSAVRYAER